MNKIKRWFVRHRNHNNSVVVEATTQMLELTSDVITVSSLKQHIYDLICRNEKLERDNDELKDRIAFAEAMQKENEIIKLTADGHLTRISSLESQLEREKSKNKDLLAELSTVRGERNTLKLENRNLKSQIDQMLAEAPLSEPKETDVNIPDSFEKKRGPGRPKKDRRCKMMQNTIGLIVIGAIILLLLIIIIHKDNVNDRLSEYVHFIERDAVIYRNAYERMCKECDDLKAVKEEYEDYED